MIKNCLYNFIVIGVWFFMVRKENDWIVVKL